MYLIYFYIVGIAAAFVLLQGMKNFITIASKPWKRLILWCGCYLTLSSIIYLGDWGNILPATTFFLLAIYIACEGSFWKKITLGLMYASTVFAFNVLRDNFLIPLDMRANSRSLSLVLSSSFSLMLALLLYLTNRKFAPDKDYRLSDSLWKLLLLLTATPLGIVLSLVLLTVLEQAGLMIDKTSFRSVCIVLLSLAMLSFIGLFRAVIVLARQQKLEEQTMLAEINRSYYESMEQQHFAIRRLKHDLLNHLSVLSVLPQEQREEYIQGLTREHTVGRPFKYCEDTVVNAVLSVKEEQMSRYGIRLQAEIQITDELPFEKADICALFANALDNAAQACRKLPPDQRRVSLKSKAQKGLFCLEVKNPARCEPWQQHDEYTRRSDTARNDKTPGNKRTPGNERTPENKRTPGKRRTDRAEIPLPQTSKPDKENHGIGLRSMQEIANRYHGKMTLQTEGEVFEVFLYLPLGEDSAISDHEMSV